MHDLIQDMGKCIVNLQKDPGKRSRLWLTKDVNEVMINNTGTNAVEVIWLPRYQELCFRKEAMKNMRRLRILRMDWIYDYDPDSSIEYMPNSLCWFSWRVYPWQSLPETFEPKRFAHLDLSWSKLCHLWMGRKDLSYLRTLNLRYSSSRLQTPDFTCIPNLEDLDLLHCESLEEVHGSLGYCNKLIRLNLKGCKSLKRFPFVNVESLEWVNLESCSSLEKFPEIIGRMKLALMINIIYSGIRELPSCVMQYQTHLTELDLRGTEKLVALPSSIGMLKSLVILNVSGCSQLESLPEEIGDLQNLVKLNAESTLISQPPSSIVCLNKLKSLSFARSEANAVHFIFPRVNGGLRSLQILDLSYCNITDGGLPEDIGCLSTLEVLDLGGNKFRRLPYSKTRLGCFLAYCESHKELPELPPNIHTLHANFHVALENIHSLASKNKKLQRVLFTFASYEDDMFAESFFQRISLCQRVIYIEEYPLMKIPSWFPRQEMNGSSLFFDLPVNWYANFLGFVVCCSGYFVEFSVELLPLSNSSSLCIRDTRSKPEKLSKTLTSRSPLLNSLFDDDEYEADVFHFVFIPLASLWDTSKTNGATSNDYRHLQLSVTPKGNRAIKELGFQLLYKDEMLARMRGKGDKSREFCVGVASFPKNQIEELCVLEPLHLYPDREVW